MADFVSAMRLEAATGLSLGDRESQEDAVLCDVPQGGGAGILVLGDGLGGHMGGAVASRLAVATALQEITIHRDADGTLPCDLPTLLRGAADAANDAILSRAEAVPDMNGMGTTLLAVVIQDDRLHWISVGDSPLYLIRDGEIRQLNEVHSLATHLDLLVRVGEMAPEEAATHPGRSCLTSALGSAKIERIDCPEAAFALEAGDVIVAASDGLLTLEAKEISAIVTQSEAASPADIARRLLGHVGEQKVKGQDNTSVAVLTASAVKERSERRRTSGAYDSVAAAVRAVLGAASGVRASATVTPIQDAGPK